MLRPADIDRLLDSLLDDLGFRVSDNERRRLVQSPPVDPEAFARAVLKAAGIDPATCDRGLLHHLASRIGDAMRAGNR